MKIFRIILLLFSFSLFGCQDVIECIVNRHPQLPNKSLSQGFINSYYSEVIEAEVKNEPQDNSYWYYYTITGDVPIGLDVYVHHRKVFIEGYPEETGDFILHLYLQVEQNDNYDCDNEWNDCDGLCDDNTSMQYTITIN